MKYAEMDDLKSFEIFGDDYLYKKYLLGFTYQYSNGRYIDVVEELRYYVLSHNTVYSINIEYQTTPEDSWIGDFQIKEIKGKLRHKKKDICNANNPKSKYVELGKLEISRGDYLDLFNHPCGDLTNGSLASYIQSKTDPYFSHNNLVDYINFIILETKAH